MGSALEGEGVYEAFGSGMVLETETNYTHPLHRWCGSALGRNPKVNPFAKSETKKRMSGMDGTVLFMVFYKRIYFKITPEEMSGHTMFRKTKYIRNMKNTP
jgi:hypothetical protein